MRKVALITGIRGTDAHYLMDNLASNGYYIHGLARRMERPCQYCVYHECDIRDTKQVADVMWSILPTHIFNLAGQSNVADSLRHSVETTETNALGTVNLLQAYKQFCPEAKFFQASSSEMFGHSVDLDGYKRETTPMAPITTYGLSKLYAHKMCEFYRESYELPISCGIMFNHTSALQKTAFLIPKVIDIAVAIKCGKQTELRIGNKDVQRDWGHSLDYVSAMRYIAEHDEPDDFVISSMQPHSVEDLVRQVFGLLDLDYLKYMVCDPKLIRDNDQALVMGDSTKARTVLKWKPTFTFESMLSDLVHNHYDYMTKHFYK